MCVFSALGIPTRDQLQLCAIDGAVERTTL